MQESESNTDQPQRSHGPALRYSLGVFVAVRLTLTVFAILMVFLFPSDVVQGTTESTTPGFAGDVADWERLLLEPWQHHDALWYVGIAAEGYGYEAYLGDTAFPPLYPALIRGVGWVLGGHYPLAAILVSNVAAFASLFLLFRLVEFELDRSTAQRATLYLAVSPVSFFLFIGYTESLFLALSIAALYFVRRGWWGRAGLMALFATWARWTGWVLAVPFLYEYLRPRDGGRPRWIALISVAAAPLGLASFLLFRELAGYTSFDEVYTAYWHTRLVPPWESLLVASRHILAGMFHPADLFDLISTFFFIGLAILGWRRIPKVYSLYLIAGILFLLIRVTEPMYTLQSQSRYLMVLFPAFMILGLLGERPWVNRVVVYASVALLLFWTGQFVIGGWVA